MCNLFCPLRLQGGKIRDLLFNLLENEEDVIVRHGTQSTENRRAATRGMHTSKFCLNPAGDTPSACRLFDSIVSLCVPVIVSDSIELPFEDVIDYRKIAIFVDTASALKPGFLISTLRSVTTERILEYQRELKEVSTICIFFFVCKIFCLFSIFPFLFIAYSLALCIGFNLSLLYLIIVVNIFFCVTRVSTLVLASLLVSYDIIHFLYITIRILQVYLK